eukprot:COSAG01_NODE_4851_length_4683_cov_2.011778_1_plen_94_part_10
MRVLHLFLRRRRLLLRLRLRPSGWSGGGIDWVAVPRVLHPPRPIRRAGSSGGAALPLWGSVVSPGPRLRCASSRGRFSALPPSNASSACSPPPP